MLLHSLDRYVLKLGERGSLLFDLLYLENSLEKVLEHHMIVLSAIEKFEELSKTVAMRTLFILKFTPK